MIEITKNKFWRNKTWNRPVVYDSPTAFKSTQWVNLFDQNGYRLTPLEQEYSQANEQRYTQHRDERSLRKVWITSLDALTGPHINHAFLFERKGYSGEALEQLKKFAELNNQIYKLINYKGKWGVDFSMDYVDSLGNSMELIHFEYDSYSLDEIEEIKGKVEERLVQVDWIQAAKLVLQRKDEWINLEFFQQSDWKTNFFGLPSERFKMNAWE
jgi:hypothetical protein